MHPADRPHALHAWSWVRAEHATLALTLCALEVAHAHEVAWGTFVLAFVLIDLVGYVPGAIAFRRRVGGRIDPIYHHLYNLTHNYLTAGLIAALWSIAAGGFEWAMLALPIHLSGDRGLFGNGFKPASLPFEPARLAAVNSPVEEVR
jgi:hypothetical protein